MSPSLFCPKSHTTSERTTARLKDHSSSVRFAHLVEDLKALRTELSEIEGDNWKLSQEIRALFHVCSDREAWCSEEGERSSLQISEACREFVKMEAGSRRLQEDMKAVDALLDRIEGNYSQRQKQLETLSLDSELLLSSLLTGGEN